MWKDFDTKFGGILKSLGRHKSFVESCAQRAQYHLYQHDITESKTASLMRFQRYEQDAQELNAKLNELVAAERLNKTKSVVQWLAAGLQPLQDHDIYCNVRVKYSKTTHWIFQQAYVREWIDSAVPSTPVLWMHGIPGAGKRQ